VEIKKTEHTEVNSAMKSIFSGAHDFIHVGALGDLSSHKRVDQLPTGTKHLQILGYANVDKSDNYSVPALILMERCSQRHQAPRLHPISMC
jgi:hypothetical protein